MTRSALRSSLLGVLVAAAFLLVPRGAEALSHMALMSGTPCSTCHVNLQGGGMRTSIGWGSMSAVGLGQYEDIGLNFMSNRETNHLYKHFVSLGFDARWQAARVGAPSITLDDNGEVQAELPPWDFFTMQLQPYLSITPHEMLTIYGTYNMGQGTLEEGDACWTPYPGQSCFEAMVVFEPHRRAPTLRAGMLQPSIGIRHDDHTMLIRQDAGRERRPVIPANYAEWGAELHYQPKYWLSFDAGAYHAGNLAESISNREWVDDDQVAWNLRATFFPQFGRPPRLRFTSLAGLSTYMADGFQMHNVFAGIGWMSRASLLFETALIGYGQWDQHNTRNISLLATIQTWQWLILQGRVEQSHATTANGDFNSFAFVGGLQFFPLPYIEIRPEYRYASNDRYSSGQYTVQLHLFY